MNEARKSKGRLITELVELSGLTRKAIGIEIGVSRNSITAYESGRINVPLNNEKLIKLFKKFKVNFLKATSTPTGKIELRNEGIIKLFDRLDPIRQQDAVNYLVTLNQSVTESIKDSIINILKESK